MKKLKLLIFLIFFASSQAETFVHLSPKAIQQGSSFKVSVQTSKKFDRGTIFFNSKSYPLYKISTDNYETILGTTFETKPGIWPAQVRFFKNNQVVFDQSPTLNLIKGKFIISTIEVSPEKEKEGATDWQVLAKENTILGKALKLQTAKKYFQGKFLVPVQYLTVSSEYGVQRKYLLQGKEISRWAHRGIDFYNKIGTPIKAAQAGLVVISQPMAVHGNTILIDHGQGIISVYNHLQESYVKTGDWINKGQLIGRIGMSGLVTGPHLHFGLSVNNVRVNPQEWFTKEF